jgi:hypothetical protein
VNKKKIVAETVFTAVQGVPIETVSEFKYLVRIVHDKDDDWPSVIRNLRRRARATWGRLASW